MKVFFSGSIRGGGEYLSYYHQILNYLRSFGEIISEHLDQEIQVDSQGKASDFAIYARDIRWIRESDLLIAEVSQPSIGVGYEIAYAEAFNKPILALYYSGAENAMSAMISGNPRITTIEYESLSDLWPLLKDELAAMVP